MNDPAKYECAIVATAVQNPRTTILLRAATNFPVTRNRSTELAIAPAAKVEEVHPHKGRRGERAEILRTTFHCRIEFDWYQCLPSRA